MAADDVPGPKNQPRFKGSGAPATAADLNIVTGYTAKLGGRMVDTNAARGALPAADLWEGLEFYETDTGLTFRRVGSGWLRTTPAISVTSAPAQAGIVSPAQTVTGLSVTIELPTAASVRVKAQLQTFSSAAGDIMVVGLRDVATSVAEWSRATNSEGANSGNSQLFEAVLPNVPAGTHTYTLVVVRASGTGSISIAPSASSTNWLTVEPIV